MGQRRGRAAARRDGAYFVFVAIDEDGRSRRVPPLAPETPADVRRQREAEIRRAHRLARKTEIDEGREG